MAENDNGITIELINEILTNVKVALGIVDNTKDTLLTLYINIICNNLLARTHRRKFIPELKYIVITLVEDKFNVNNKDNPDLTAIQSMSEAGRSVNFGASNIVATKLNMIAQKQLDENEALIREFKLLYKL